MTTKHGKTPSREDTGHVGYQGALRQVFCDGGLESPAQRHATEECKRPQQPIHKKDEPFEPYGLN